MAAESSPPALDGRWTRLRTHKRILASVNLVVEWKQGRELRSTNAFTLDVSYSGCLAVVATELQLEQQVRLINRQSGSAAEARVAWRSPATRDVGLELLKPDAAFWNL